jgi:hypothetical protein|tara:strand:- start:238 stop:423 length:186 start_codon:yes stop_codon:yes gene_type:complete
MELGPLIVLFKLFGSDGVVSPNGPVDVPTNQKLKPTCPSGHYAYKDPLTGLWSCLLIPKGR